MFHRIRTFVQDVIAEFRRVSWPTRRETMVFTGAVLLITMFFAVFLGVVDLGLSETVKWLIG